MKKKLLKFGAWGFLGLAALLVIVRGVAESRSTKALKEFKETLKAEGQPVSMREMVVSVPREQNAAVVLDEMQTSLTLRIDPRIGEQDIQWRSNALENPHSLTVEERALFIQFIDENPEFLDYLRRIAECEDFGYLPQDFSLPYHKWEGPNMKGIIERFRLLFIAASVLALEGKTDQALEIWRLGKEASRHLMSPTFTAAILRGSFAQIYALSSSKHVFADKNIAGDILWKTARELTVSNNRETLFQSLEENRLVCLILGEEFIQYETLFFDLNRTPVREFYLGEPNSENSTKARLERAVYFFERPLWRRQLEKMQKRSVAVNHIFKLDPWLWNKELEKTYDELDLKNSFLGEWTPYDTTLIASYAVRKVSRIIIQVETLRQMASLALACKAWRYNHGDWPESLDLLENGYGGKIPVDPCTGKPFFYETGDGGFVLQSAGPDGIMESESRDGKSVSEKSDDIVWAEKVPGEIKSPSGTD